MVEEEGDLAKRVSGWLEANDEERTSGIRKCPATIRAPSKLSMESLKSSLRGIWAPVMMTVFLWTEDGEPS